MGLAELIRNVRRFGSLKRPGEFDKLVEIAALLTHHNDFHMKPNGYFTKGFFDKEKAALLAFGVQEYFRENKVSIDDLTNFAPKKSEFRLLIKEFVEQYAGELDSYNSNNKPVSLNPSSIANYQLSVSAHGLEPPFFKNGFSGIILKVGDYQVMARHDLLGLLPDSKSDSNNKDKATVWAYVLDTKHVKALEKSPFKNINSNFTNKNPYVYEEFFFFKPEEQLKKLGITSASDDFKSGFLYFRLEFNIAKDDEGSYNLHFNKPVLGLYFIDKSSFEKSLTGKGGFLKNKGYLMLPKVDFDEFFIKHLTSEKNARFLEEHAINAKPLLLKSDKKTNNNYSPV